MTDPLPVPSATPRLDAIRAGIAEGQDLGIFAELIEVIDVVFAALDIRQWRILALMADAGITVPGQVGCASTASIEVIGWVTVEPSTSADLRAIGVWLEADGVVG